MNVHSSIIAVLSKRLLSHEQMQLHGHMVKGAEGKWQLQWNIKWEHQN